MYITFGIIFDEVLFSSLTYWLLPFSGVAAAQSQSMASWMYYADVTMAGTRVASSPCAEDTWPRKARRICLLDSVLLTMSGLLTRLDLRWWLLTVLSPGRRFCLCLSDHDAFHTFLWLYFLRAVSELYWFSPAILSILNSSPSFFRICCLSFFHPSPPLSVCACVLAVCMRLCACLLVTEMNTW